jgi:hypothetical protein
MDKFGTKAGALKQVLGYYYAYRNYLNTPKGRHDAVDYARAAIVIMGIAILLIGIIQWWHTT